MVLGDPGNTILQPSMRDVMKACTRVFADSASSDRRILRIWRSQKKCDKLIVPTCFTGLRSDEMVTPSKRTWSLAVIVSSLSRSGGPLPLYSVHALHSIGQTIIIIIIIILVGEPLIKPVKHHQNSLCVFITYREIRRRNFEGIHGLEDRPLTLILQVVKRCFFRHEVRMPDDRSYKEPVVSRLLTSCYLLTFHIS